MIIKKEVKGKRIFEASGLVRGYATDPDHPYYDDHIFLMFKMLPGNALLHSQFESQYGDAFVTMYVKHIDFKPYNIYVFKRELSVINEVLNWSSIEHKLPLEDDDSLYLPDDYSFTIEKRKRALGN